MKKNEAITNLEEYSRAIVTSKFAKEIAEALGCSFNKKLIKDKFYRTIRYNDESSVSISELAMDIAEQKNLKPDYSLAHRLHGIGSSAEEYTKAVIKVL